MKKLTERHKADRALMAVAIEALAAEFGAKVEREEGGTYPGPRAIRLTLKLRSVSVSVELNGDSSTPDFWVIGWRIDPASSATFAANLTPMVNSCHRQKATDGAHGFEHLCDTLRDRLAKIANGTAFEPS